MARKKALALRSAPGSRIDVTDILERVTRAEERVVSMDRVQIEWRDETREAHRDLSERLGKLELALNKYQGAWGMLSLLLSAIVVAVTMLKDWFLAHWER